MPSLPLQPCARCKRVLVPKGTARCPSCHAKHQAQLNAEDVAHRGTAAQRGYDAAWRKLRAAYAKQHPLCEDCLERGQRVPVAEVHHIRPHRGDDSLRLDWHNLRSLCLACHSTTKREAGYRAPEKLNHIARCQMTDAPVVLARTPPE